MTRVAPVSARSASKNVGPSASMRIGAFLILLGPLIVVAGGRWGSYLGLSSASLYLTDVSFALGVALMLLGMASPQYRRHRAEVGKSETTKVSVLIKWSTALLLVVAAIGVLRGPGFSILTIRDLLPFAYLAAIPIFIKAAGLLGPEFVMKWISRAAIFHLIWFVLRVFRILPEIDIPAIGGAPLFSSRGDFDGMITGLGLACVAASKNMNRFVRLVLLLAGLAAMVAQGSRAGLLSGLAIVILFALFSRPFKDARTGPIRVVLASVSVAAVIAFIPTLSDPPEWAAGLLKLIPSDDAAYTSGQNTANARSNAWTAVYDYVTQDQTSTFFGQGFGAQVIRDSGAVQYLSGDESVRQAHNFVVTWFGMTGYVGVSLTLLALLLLAVYTLRRATIWTANSLGAAVMAGVIISASVGVILESPFGYLSLALALVMSSLPKPADVQPPIREVPADRWQRSLRNSQWRA